MSLLMLLITWVTEIICLHWVKVKVFVYTVPLLSVYDKGTSSLASLLSSLIFAQSISGLGFNLKILPEAVYSGLKLF